MLQDPATMKPRKEGAEEKNQNALQPIDIIRTETVLSRLPIHQLSKRGSIPIRIQRDGLDGNSKLFWEAIPNAAIGEPRALAYKLDTLIVNRVLDEKGSDFPRLVKMLSLSETARRLGHGGDNQAIKKAYEQNASVIIRSRLTYRSADGTEHEVESFGTRYTVHFWNHLLPDGTRADSVYLSFTDPFYDLLRSAVRRPLDYDYLASLPPSAQRWYELASYQIFGAMKRNKHEAILRYSEYCLFATQTRYFDSARVQKQMYKVHQPHKKSGYIEWARFEKLTGDDGQADWAMVYRPGPRAWNEYRTFNPKARGSEAVSKPTSPAPVVEFKAREEVAHIEPDLLESLTSRGIVEANARKLLVDLDGKKLDHIADCIRYWEAHKSLGAGALHKLITRELEFPATFETTTKQRERGQREKEKRRAAALATEAELAYNAYSKLELEQYLAGLPTGDYEKRLEVAKAEVLATVSGASAWKDEQVVNLARYKLQPDLARAAGLMGKKEFVDRFIADENFRAQHGQPSSAVHRANGSA